MQAIAVRRRQISAVGALAVDLGGPAAFGVACALRAWLLLGWCWFASSASGGRNPRLSCGDKVAGLVRDLARSRPGRAGHLASVTAALPAAVTVTRS
jgi:hypothetical protein